MEARETKRALALFMGGKKSGRREATFLAMGKATDLLASSWSSYSQCCIIFKRKKIHFGGYLEHDFQVIAIRFRQGEL